METQLHEVANVIGESKRKTKQLDATQEEAKLQLQDAAGQRKACGGARRG